jgi:uncharacterized membrane protein YidH (DUF202 family)
MQSNIPLPTDNIYKFYALFGLLLIISSILAFVYVNSQTFNSGFTLVKEYEALKNMPSNKDSLTLHLIEGQIKVLGDNKKFQLQFLGGLIGIGLLLMAYGFWHWHHKIQPQHDRLLKLQILKLEKEVDTDLEK